MKEKIKDWLYWEAMRGIVLFLLIATPLSIILEWYWLTVSLIIFTIAYFVFCKNYEKNLYHHRHRWGSIASATRGIAASVHTLLTLQF